MPSTDTRLSYFPYHQASAAFSSNYPNTLFQIHHDFQPVSPDTIFVSLLFKTAESPKTTGQDEYQILRLEFDKNDTNGKHIFQELMSTYLRVRGWKRKYSLWGAKDLKFAQVSDNPSV